MTTVVLKYPPLVLASVEVGAASVVTIEQDRERLSVVADGETVFSAPVWDLMFAAYHQAQLDAEAAAGTDPAGSGKNL